MNLLKFGFITTFLVLISFSFAFASDRGTRELMRAWIDGDDSKFPAYVNALKRAGREHSEEMEAARNLWAQKKAVAALFGIVDNLSTHVSTAQLLKKTAFAAKQVLEEGQPFGITQAHITKAFEDAKSDSERAVIVKGAILINAANEQPQQYLTQDEIRRTYPAYSDTRRLTRNILLSIIPIGLWFYFKENVPLSEILIYGGAAAIPAACFYALSCRQEAGIEKSGLLRRGLIKRQP